jgi:hypothetical protein
LSMRTVIVVLSGIGSSLRVVAMYTSEYNCTIGTARVQRAECAPCTLDNTLAIAPYASGALSRGA